MEVNVDSEFANDCHTPWLMMISAEEIANTLIPCYSLWLSLKREGKHSFRVEEEKDEETKLFIMHFILSFRVHR